MKVTILFIFFCFLSFQCFSQYIRLTNNLLTVDHYPTTFGDSVFWSMDIGNGKEAIMMYDGERITRFTNDNGKINRYLITNGIIYVWQTQDNSSSNKKLQLFNNTDTINLNTTNDFLTIDNYEVFPYSIYQNQVIWRGPTTTSNNYDYIFYYNGSITQTIQITAPKKPLHPKILRGQPWWEESEYVYGQTKYSIKTKQNGIISQLSVPNSSSNYGLNGNDSLLSFIAIGSNGKANVYSYDYSIIKKISPDTILYCLSTVIDSKNVIYWVGDDAIYLYKNNQVQVLCSSCIFYNTPLQPANGGGLFWDYYENNKRFGNYFDGTTIHRLPDDITVFGSQIGSRWIAWEKETYSGIDIYLYDYKKLSSSENFLADNTISYIKIFPNPCKNFIELQFSGNCEKKFSYTIYNVQGIPVLKNTNQITDSRISLENLLSGTYIIQVNIASNTFIDKIIIE